MQHSQHSIVLAALGLDRDLGNILDRRPALLNARNEWVRTPLHWASERKPREVRWHCCSSAAQRGSSATKWE